MRRVRVREKSPGRARERARVRLRAWWRAEAEAEAEVRAAVREEQGTPEVEALLAAVRRAGPRPGEAGAEAALAAFREARDSGAHALPGRWWRVRRRDDWRPSRRRRGALPVKAAFATVAATVTLGGMALAAGTGAIPSPFGGGGSEGGGAAGTSSGAPAATPGNAAGEGAARRPSATATRSASGRPTRAQDEEALCVAHLVSHGRAISPRGAAAERLAAGAAYAGLTVEAYCEGVLAAARREPGPGAAGKGATKPPKVPDTSKPAGVPNPPAPEAKPDAAPADPAKPPAKGDVGGDSGRQGANGTEGNGGEGEPRRP